MSIVEPVTVANHVDINTVERVTVGSCKDICMTEPVTVGSCTDICMTERHETAATIAEAVALYLDKRDG